MKQVVALFCLVLITAFSNAETFKFSDFPVSKVYQGKSAKLFVKSDFEKNYKTRLNLALKQNANFAGEYIVTYWGCGAGCRTHSIINKRTGEVLDQGFGGEMGPYLQDFKLNSRLIITHGPELNKDGDEVEDGKYFTYYYVVEKNKIKFIGKELRKRPDFSDIYVE